MTKFRICKSKIKKGDVRRFALHHQFIRFSNIDAMHRGLGGGRDRTNMKAFYFACLVYRYM